MNEHCTIEKGKGQADWLTEKVGRLLEADYLPKRADNDRLAKLMSEVKGDFEAGNTRLYDDIIERRCEEKGWEAWAERHTWKRRTMKRAQDFDSCGKYLEFGWHAEEEALRLQYANFCKARLCPMCGWRRSLKLFGQLSEIVDHVVDDGYSFVFMTLTVRNVPLPELSGTIDRMMDGFRKLFQRRCLPSKQGKRGEPNPVFAMSRGFFRSLEITVSETGECHPHFHVLVAVDKDYFTSGEYLHTWELSRIWRAFLEVDYDPVVDLRAPQVYRKSDRCGVDDKEVLKDAVREIAKYTVKSSDIVRGFGNEEARKRCLFGLDYALSGRRLIGFSGVFREWHDVLRMSDAEDVGVKDEMLNKTVADLVIVCNWKGMGWVMDVVKPKDEEPF